MPNTALESFKNPTANPTRTRTFVGRKSAHSKSETPDLHQAVIDLYHECLPNAPGVKAWTPKRRQALDARICERLADHKPADQPDYWRTFFENVAASDFLAGRTTDFCADLEWLLEPKNFLHVIEGRFTNRIVKGSRHAAA